MKSPLRDYTALELIAVGLFTIAGSIMGLAFAIVYIGMAALSLVGEHIVWILK